MISAVYLPSELDKYFKFNSYKVGVLKGKADLPKLVRQFGKTIVTKRKLGEATHYANIDRPFLSKFVEKNRILIELLVQKSLVYKGSVRNLFIEKGLAKLMENFILKHPWKPNKSSTIRVKGSAKPLINTRQMLKSIKAEGFIR